MTTAILTAAEYHTDPGDTPTLNSTTARTLLLRTPAHAYAEHPRLGGERKESTAAMSMGTAVHQLLLRDDRVDVLDFPDWRTKAAQEAKQVSLEQGRVPMLTKDWAKAQAIADRVRQQIRGLNARPLPFTAGTPEHALRFQDNGAECRALIDWLRDDRSSIDDLKVTGLTADPARWSRKLFNDGYDIQAAFYIRAVEAAYGKTPAFRWLVVETNPPYPVSIITLSEQAMFAARVKVDAAISMWNTCMATDSWPAYSPDVYVAEVPGWMKDQAADPWAGVELEEVSF